MVWVMKLPLIRRVLNEKEKKEKIYQKHLLYTKKVLALRWMDTTGSKMGYACI
jgi:hypothetical protein